MPNRNEKNKTTGLNIESRYYDMTTLLEVHTTSGIVGRCDAKCYNAKHEKCTCVCCGRNHGKGLAQALEQTQDEFERWVEMYAQENGLTVTSAVLLPVQMSLFD